MAVDGRPDPPGADRAPRRWRTWRATPPAGSSGREAFRDWMQELADRAIAELGGTHFDIPEPIRRIECMLAPTNDGGIYYTGPSEDFSPAGPDVVVGARRHRRVPPVARGHDRLPRGRARPSPPGRADRAAQRRPQPLAATDVLGQRPRRGLGAVRRAADGRARVPRRPGRPARDARRAGVPGGPGDRRHRDAPRAGDPARQPVRLPPRRDGGPPTSASSSCASTRAMEDSFIRSR